MDKATFLDIYYYADDWIAMDFEGVEFPGPYTFNESNYLQMRLYQKIKLDNIFDVASRRLVFSRMLRKPLAEMKSKVNCQINGCEDPSPLKYMVYSGHDD